MKPQSKKMKLLSPWSCSWRNSTVEIYLLEAEVCETVPDGLSYTLGIKWNQKGSQQSWSATESQCRWWCFQWSVCRSVPWPVTVWGLCNVFPLHISTSLAHRCGAVPFFIDSRSLLVNRTFTRALRTFTLRTNRRLVPRKKKTMCPGAKTAGRLTTTTRY